MIVAFLKQILFFLLYFHGLTLYAYQLSGQKWSTNTTHFNVDIPGSNNLWNNAFNNALLSWNASSRFSFTSSRSYADPCLDDGKNGVGFSASACGSSFGSTTLAVTLTKYSLPDQNLIETDIVFNNNKSWSVYSGNQQSTTYDFQRVAVHELGHTLGLGHETNTNSMMNPMIGNLETPQADDIRGVAALYSSGYKTRHDFNNNTQSDILWRHPGTGMNWIYLMNGSVIQQSTKLNVVDDPNWIVAATGDFNGDNYTDILWRNISTGVNWLYSMQGTTILQSAPVNQVPDQKWKIAGVGDFDGNGKDDILWRHETSGQNWLYFMDGNNILKTSIINTIDDTNWEIATLGDFNGDQKTDILWRHRLTGINWIYLMDGVVITTSFALNRVTDLNWQIAGSGDFDGDGTDDIAWRHAESGQNYIYLINNGNIKMADVINAIADTNWRIAALGDYNGDRKADILWHHSITGLVWLYTMNGSQIIESNRVSLVTDLSWTIVND